MAGIMGVPFLFLVSQLKINIYVAAVSIISVNYNFPIIYITNCVCVCEHTWACVILCIIPQINTNFIRPILDTTSLNKYIEHTEIFLQIMLLLILHLPSADLVSCRLKFSLVFFRYG